MEEWGPAPPWFQWMTFLRANPKSQIQRVEEDLGWQGESGSAGTAGLAEGANRCPCMEEVVVVGMAAGLREAEETAAPALRPACAARAVKRQETSTISARTTTTSWNRWGEGKVEEEVEEEVWAQALSLNLRASRGGRVEGSANHLGGSTRMTHLSTFRKRRQVGWEV